MTTWFKPSTTDFNSSCNASVDACDCMVSAILNTSFPQSTALALNCTVKCLLEEPAVTKQCRSECRRCSKADECQPKSRCGTVRLWPARDRKAGRPEDSVEAEHALQRIIRHVGTQP